MDASAEEALSPKLRTQADIINQPNDIQSKRTEMMDLDALRAFNSEELRLRTLWNSSLPVNHLPNELLVGIFRLDAEEPMSEFPMSMRWVRLMLVCKYWREVASTPTLWSNIAVSGSAAAWLDLCLVRSAETTLRISLTKPTPEMIRHVASYSTRIEAIAIYDPEHPPSNITGDNLIPLEAPMPILHHLMVDGQAAFIDIDLTSARYPVLRSLDLRFAAIVSDTNLYAGLRRLSLTACRYRDGPTLKQFSDALRVATRLESLSISGVLVGVPNKGMPPGSPPLAFPHLADFYLEENLEDARLFMTLIRLPHTCSIAVYGRSDGRIDEWEEITISELLPRRDDTRSVALPMLSSPTAVELIMNKGDYILHGTSTTCGAIHLSITSSPLANWELFLEVGLRDVVHVCGAAPVRRLRVTGDHRAFSLAAAWRAVFEAFPMLDTLEVSGAGSPAGLWRGLRMAEPPITQSPGIGRAFAAACPNLRTVSVVQCVDGRSKTVSVQFFEAMLDCLRHRAKDDARLEALHLTLSPGREDFDRLKHRYLSHVQELVEHVSYDVYDGVD
ncbi:hypothetical protein K466DRAFT_589116 [Polyporus arcularius HHB13444]|uniref:F-box domain-containing protein n=1 Tax=Polyporus arcularius HHB13444 TaxID=1314778 RepID=A0A5C3P3I5_9APHY|nr:hypothetical protein K466DRAFT_589116 [Polyporus arcularius HHB13444]